MSEEGETTIGAPSIAASQRSMNKIPSKSQENFATKSDDKDLIDDLDDKQNDGPQSDFVMQQSECDLEDVGNIFAAAEEIQEGFKEAEEAGLYPISEEGQDEEEFEEGENTAERLFEDEFEGDVYLYEGIEGYFGIEEEIVGEGEGEAEIVAEEDDAKAHQQYLEQEKAIAARVGRERESIKSDQESLGVKDVGVKDRYDLLTDRLSGDFTTTHEPDEIFSHQRTSYGSVSILSEDDELGAQIEEEKVEEEEEMEEEEECIDREPYYELYRSLMKEYPMLKMKNNFLQRKMAEYFKRRKMEHVLRESERINEAQTKYYKKLDALWELRNTNNMQRNIITAELNEMKSMRDRQVNTVMENFEAMQTRERDIGKGLIFTKTAKEIPEKFLDRLLKNQRTKSREIMEMRLSYIKLRNNIDEITAAIKAMDKIGEDHTLIDFEQLKMENQNHADKIEERDEELSKLRTKCAAAIQTLAHLREKSSSTDIDILEMSDKLDDVEMDKNDWREKVNQLKQERDNLRAAIVKLQEDSGLLTKPKLLLDMEDTIDKITKCKEEVSKINATYSAKAIALEAIKKNIQEEKEYFRPTIKFKKESPKITKVYKGKPRLVYSTLEHFDIKQLQH